MRAGLYWRLVRVVSLALASNACRLVPPNANDYRETEPSGTSTLGDDLPTAVSGTSGATPGDTTENPSDTSVGSGSDSGSGDTGPFCGDEIVEGGEECDDGRETATCNENCTLAACGDGVRNESADEQCDEGPETTTCDEDCTLVVCGDGLINEPAGEVCDDGGESATCNVDCTPAICGDNVTNASANEQCDDAGRTGACDADCTLVDCGDGYRNASAGEECDDGGESMLCNIDCTVAECGDGIINAAASEQCDTMGVSLGCDEDCTVVECGDLTINTVAGEECDDTNLAGTTCEIEGFDGGTLACDDVSCQLDTSGCFACGDGVRNGAEQCDGGDLGGQVCESQGYDGGALGCTGSCAYDYSGCYVCGDGAINPGEQCDGANLGGQSCASQGLGGGTLGCTGSCVYDYSGCYECGDGAINPGESCDGANLGGETCASQGFGGGTLSCTGSCAFDTSACLSCVVTACGDLVMWLRADAGVTTNASGVTMWADQSGAANDATQASAINEPALLNGALNGLPAINFLGDDWLIFDSALSLQDLTIFVVARNNGAGVGMILGPAAVNNQIRYENPTQILSVGVGNGLSSITSTIGDNQVHHSLSIRYDGATWEVWRDGLLASSTPEGVTGPLTLGRLGSWFSGQFGLIGEIAEVMVYDVALSPAEREAVEDYLRTKYALP